MPLIRLSLALKLICAVLLGMSFVHTANSAQTITQNLAEIDATKLKGIFEDPNTKITSLDGKAMFFGVKGVEGQIYFDEPTANENLRFFYQDFKFENSNYCCRGKIFAEAFLEKQNVGEGSVIFQKDFFGTRKPIAKFNAGPEWHQPTSTVEDASANRDLISIRVSSAYNAGNKLNLAVTGDMLIFDHISRQVSLYSQRVHTVKVGKRSQQITLDLSDLAYDIDILRPAGPKFEDVAFVLVNGKTVKVKFRKTDNSTIVITADEADYKFEVGSLINLPLGLYLKNLHPEKYLVSYDEAIACSEAAGQLVQEKLKKALSYNTALVKGAENIVPTVPLDVLQISFENGFGGWFHISEEPSLIGVGSTDYSSASLLVRQMQPDFAQRRYAPHGENYISLKSIKCAQSLGRWIHGLVPGAQYSFSMEVKPRYSVKKHHPRIILFDKNGVIKSSIIEKSPEANHWHWHFKKFTATDTSLFVALIVPEKSGSVAFDNLQIHRLNYATKTASENTVPENFFEVLDLKVNEMALEEISGTMQANGLFYDQPDSKIGWVDGNLQIPNGDTLKVKVSPHKGGPINWAHHEKHSLKIRVEDQTYGGIKKFRLQVPRSRQGIWEGVSNFIAKQMGLIVPEIRFVWLRVNGRNVGLYYLIEGFTKEMLERQSVAASDIFGESDEWKAHEKKAVTDFRKYVDVEVAVKNDFTMLDKMLVSMFNQSDSDDVWSVLDKASTLKWISHQRVLNSIHQDKHHNNRFFFSPTSGKFQFIPWDLLNVYYIDPLKLNDAQGRHTSIDRKYNHFVDQIISDPKRYTDRNKELWSYVADDQNINELIAHVNELQSLYALSFRFENDKNFTISDFNNEMIQKTTLVENIFKIRNHLSESATVYGKARLNSQPQVIRPGNLLGDIEFSNGSLSTAVVTRLKLEFSEKLPKLAQSIGSIGLVHDLNGNGKLDAGDKRVARLKFRNRSSASLENFSFHIEPKRIFPEASYAEQKFEYVILEPRVERFFFLNESAIDLPKLSDLKFRLKNGSSGKKIDHEKYLLRKPLGANTLGVAIGGTTDLDLHFATHGESIFIGPGQVEILEDIIIPKGTVLHIAPGTTFNIGSGVSIIVYGTILSEGTEANPIIYTAKNKAEGWGALAVIGDDSSGVFQNCLFEFGSEARINGLLISGMFSAYHTDVMINGCEFNSALGEDSVNLKSGRSKLTNSKFKGNVSDALDLDFMEMGTTVKNNFFLSNNGDSIDISGSASLVQNNWVQGSGDKGISIGEGSKDLILDNLLLANTIGIAIKDGANIEFVNNTVARNQVGVAIYQKKDIFGQPAVNVQNSVFVENEFDFAAENSSNLSKPKSHPGFAITNSHYSSNEGLIDYNMLSIKPVLGQRGMKNRAKDEIRKRNEKPQNLRERVISLTSFVPDPDDNWIDELSLQELHENYVLKDKSKFHSSMNTNLPTEIFPPSQLEGFAFPIGKITPIKRRD